MNRRGWARNAKFKIAAVLAALLSTLGFYGLIQANPPANSARSADVSPTPPRDVVGGPAASAPSSLSTGAGSIGAGRSSIALPPVDAPAVRPIRPATRTRAS
ncbi:MAG: hypothetical protein ACR2PL_24300 [Dehalococcoidia bacterium]